MEGLRVRIAGLLTTLFAVVALLVVASPTVASGADTVVHVQKPSTTRAYLPVTPPATVAAGGEPTVARSPEEVEREFVVLLNDLRASRGLATLDVNRGLTDVARSWAASMAAAGQISHRSDLAEVSPEPSWVRIGENVGVGADVASLHDAFVASPAHLDNMVDPGWHLVGVGVSLEDDGTIYVAVNFLEVEQ